MNLRLYFVATPIDDNLFDGIRTIPLTGNYLTVMVRVWVRVRDSCRVGGQFSSGAIVLEPALIIQFFLKILKRN